MDTQRWQRIGAIFDAAIEVPEMERAGLLDSLCADDAELRGEVETLLAADAAAHRFERSVDSARASAAAAWVADGESEFIHAGDTIGPWRVLRELGRGGMGVVWLAERADGQFEQRAALKLIKRGMDSEAVIARFLRERQILARLEHPHIARLLDGGIATDGRPYFAMEYVDGQPLLGYCTDKNIKLEERIKLFLDICTAVQFAHGQLVVHRDLKPSNVLVKADGDIKLLDFGIAKLLGAEESAAMTATAQWNDHPLTVAYAAPEQLCGKPVTTATDIYALGCVFYELLTGRRPFDLADTPSLDDVRRVLESTSPVAPSKLADGSVPVPARRLRGDLDTIILTALKRDPQRRYATVETFANDVQRYLDGQPIVARRDHTWYRIGKFVGRHRIGVAAAAAGIVVLIAALGIALWQAREKTREAKASQEVTQFLVGLFAAADPTHSQGAAVSAQDLLDQGAQRLRSELTTEPVLRARLLHTVAITYMALGLYDRALPVAERALSLRRDNLPASDLEVAESMDDLGQIYTLKADYAKAEPLLRDALVLRRTELGADDPAVIDSLGNLGLLLQNRGDFAGADGPFREALAASESRFGADAAETAHRLDDLATNQDNLGKSADALTMYRRALAIREGTLGPDDAEVATSLQNLGTHLGDAGNYDEARRVLERALAIRRKIYGPTHPLFGFAELALAGVYDSVNRIEDAERAANDALAIFRKTLPENHPKISESLNMLAFLRTVHRDFVGAVPLFRDVLARFRKTLGADHPDTLIAQNNLAATLQHAGGLAEAEQLQRDVLVRVRGDNGQGVVATDCENLAATLEQEDKFAEAVTFSRQALELQKKREGEISGNVAVALKGLAIAEEFDGDAAQAEKDLRATLRMGEQLHASQGIDLFQWQIPLADFLVGAQHCDEAIPLLESALAALHAGTDPLWQPLTRILLGHCLAASNRHDEGVAMEKTARATLHTMPGIEVDAYPTARKLFTADSNASLAKSR